MKWTNLFWITLFGLTFFLSSQTVFAQDKQVVVIPLGNDAVQGKGWTISGADIYNSNTGNVGIGISTPGQKLHIGDGNLLLEGGGETAIQVKRDEVFSNSHVQSPFKNPIFGIGRIIEGGDGAPQFRWMYDDDEDIEHVVMELDSEGIMSSVRRSSNRGSHFEGHLSGETHPLFRLNSYPYMQLQLGPGGSSDTDVAIARTGINKIALVTNNISQLVVDGSGKVGIGTTEPLSKFAVSGLPTSPPDASGNAGVVCVTNDGNFWLDNDGTNDCQ